MGKSGSETGMEGRKTRKQVIRASNWGLTHWNSGRLFNKQPQSCPSSKDFSTHVHQWLMNGSSPPLDRHKFPDPSGAQYVKSKAPVDTESCWVHSPCYSLMFGSQASMPINEKSSKMGRISRDLQKKTLNLTHFSSLWTWTSILDL